MATLDHPTIHREHHEAECDHVTWLEDVGRWRAEHRRAASMLAQIQAALLDHESALEAHAETIRVHESRLRRHEREFANQERGGTETDHGKVKHPLQEFQDEHGQAREAHQRIRTHHGMVTAEIKRLFEKLTAPM